MANETKVVLSDEFWSPKKFTNAQRARCKLHSTQDMDVWVSTHWEKKNPGTPAEVYDVTATAVNGMFCQSHLGDTDTMTIAKAAWINADENKTWDFF